MKQTLQIRLGQQLTMTPQLQQAIRMLQLSTLELQMEVQQALESNLMLEVAEEGEEVDAKDPKELAQSEPVEPEEQPVAPDKQPDAEEGSAEEMSMATEIPEELSVDSVWEDVYESTNHSQSNTSGEDRDFDFGDTAGESLREHLLWQMEMATLSDVDRTIAETIIDSISDDGFLTTPLESFYQELVVQNEDLDEDEVETVLHIIQNFDPPGVAARDLRECLLLQLRVLPADTPWLEEMGRLLQRHFELLASRDYTQLNKRMKLSESDLVEVVRSIQSLNPRPGSQFNSGRTQYIVPDVMVQKAKGRWRVELNHDAVPRLRINNHYASLIKQVNSGSETATMKNHLQEARWFLKSLQSRSDTLLRVASSIVRHQQGFLEHGDVAMKPMVLHDIAEELEMHESTISRTTTRKYMHTPRGIFELKYFFSSHVGTAAGGECSSTAIRAMIRVMISDEVPLKPLSDSKIAARLSEQGINVARRTVAKYREAMAIPPSNERKRLA